MRRRFLVWLLAVAMLFGLAAMPTTVANAENATGNVIVSVPWELINKCGHQAVSGPCQAYCWAYCRIILDHTSHTYRDYWTRYQGNDGKWHETAAVPSAAGYTSQTAKMTSKQIFLKTICDNVDEGRPVVVRVKGSKAFHYVTAIGYREGCDMNNLTESDILILDPASKSIQATAGAKETYTYLNSRTLSPTDDGKYVCWTTESKGAGTETKPPIMQAGKASKPVVSVRNTEVTISWSHSGTSTGYDVYLVQSPWRWEDIKYHASTVSSPCIFQNVAQGDYQAFVIVRPNDITEQSEWTFFTVRPVNPKNVKITFDANGGNVSLGSKTITAGSCLTGLPTARDRNGYTFLDWTMDRIDPDASGIYTTTVVREGASSFDADTTLYAHWSKDVTSPPPTDQPPLPASIYTVYFDADGGSVSPGSINVKFASRYGNLPTPSKSGYTFDGWYTAEGHRMTSNTLFDKSSDITLYARWAKEEPVNCSHTKGRLQYSESSHPHYNYYVCAKCGELFTDYSTTPDTSCEDCWGPWSKWSTTPVYLSSTRQVETRTVKTSDGATEYRYGRYIDSTGGHICWCSTYLGSKGYSGITVQYSSWSTTRYGASGKVWTCGNCNGSHTGIDHYDSQGRPAWKEYSLSSGNYYWEESRQTSDTYETQYRYRDWFSE